MQCNPSSSVEYMLIINMIWVGDSKFSLLEIGEKMRRIRLYWKDLYEICMHQFRSRYKQNNKDDFPIILIINEKDR